MQKKAKQSTIVKKIISPVKDLQRPKFTISNKKEMKPAAVVVEKTHEKKKVELKKNNSV